MEFGACRLPAGHRKLSPVIGDLTRGADACAASAVTVHREGWFRCRHLCGSRRDGGRLAPVFPEQVVLRFTRFRYQFLDFFGSGRGLAGLVAGGLPDPFHLDLVVELVTDGGCPFVAAVPGEDLTL